MTRYTDAIYCQYLGKDVKCGDKKCSECEHKRKIETKYKEGEKSNDHKR